MLGKRARTVKWTWSWGRRSAVFAPLAGVRFIVVDEAHESSYKQDTSPRYHAVSVARERMRIEHGTLVLGSATPSLESYAEALAHRTDFLELTHRATRQPLPAVHVMDMTREFEGGNRRIFSSALTQGLNDRFQRGEKAVLFVNRRGSAGFLLCRNCGSVPECTRCSVSLTVHRSEGLLRCHYCDLQMPVSLACSACHQETIREFGVGTERVAQEVERLYPHARIVRMDSDTTTRVGDHARLLDEFALEGDVLVGTQMVAKGLDFPTVTLVGVVAADHRTACGGFSRRRTQFRAYHTSVRAQRTRASGRSDRANVFARASCDCVLCDARLPRVRRRRVGRAIGSCAFRRFATLSMSASSAEIEQERSRRRDGTQACWKRPA